MHMDARIPLADPMPASPITRPRSFNIRQHRGAQHLHVDIASHHGSEYRSTAATDIKRRQLINRDPPAPPPRPSQIPPFYPSIYREPSLHRFRTSRAQRQRQTRTHSSMRISGLHPPLPSSRSFGHFSFSSRIRGIAALLTISPAIIKTETICLVPLVFCSSLIFPSPPIPPPVPTPPYCR